MAVPKLPGYKENHQTRRIGGQNVMALFKLKKNRQDQLKDVYEKQFGSFVGSGNRAGRRFGAGRMERHGGFGGFRCRANQCRVGFLRTPRR
jgi:hypothetical protein